MNTHISSESFPSQDKLHTLLTSLDEQQFFTSLALLTKNIMTVDEVLIYKVFEDGSGQLVAINDSVVENSGVFPRGRGPISYVLRKKTPYYCNQLTRDPLYDGCEDIEKITAELTFPLIVKDQIMGVIALRNYAEEKKFNEVDGEKMHSFVKSIERYLVNMHMYLMAKHLSEKLQRQLESQEKNMTMSFDRERDKGSAVDFITHSEQMKTIRDYIVRIGSSMNHLLITGEAGVGKELIARKLKERDTRSYVPFIVFNCGAYDKEFSEKELFGASAPGHDQGGLLHMADGGYLYLDEVADLSLDMQLKLLRYLKFKEAYKKGSDEPYHVHVRIICASKRDLKKRVQEGHFREDLYYLLSTMQIEVPPLRERTADIAVVAHHFLNRMNTAGELRLAREVIEHLEEYQWPGNISELRNVMERVSVLAEGTTVVLEDLPRNILCAKVEKASVQIAEEESTAELISLKDLEKDHIVKTLQAMNGNKTRTAKSLGITVKTLYNKLHSYEIVTELQ